MNNKTWTVLGIMSGTSLDGVDFCLSRFTPSANGWDFTIEQAETISYDETWLARLRFNPQLSATDLLQLDSDYGNHLAKLTCAFLKKHNIESGTIDAIASHGHTLYHQPQKRYTCQIGNGPQIFTQLGVTTICDFRTQDIALGGQGAPLVPMGDALLFSNYQACLNLGGFANISFSNEMGRTAFDICAVNFVFNHLSEKLGYSFDKDGALAKSGNVNQVLLKKLNHLDYYKQKWPKSLGAEWVNQQVFPLLKSAGLSETDSLATYAHHAAQQIKLVLNQHSIKNCLLTGGGAFNSYFVQLLSESSTCKIEIPDHNLINYKEALIFAFLGVLKLQNKNNVLSQVTGSSRDHSAGIIYQS